MMRSSPKHCAVGFIALICSLFFYGCDNKSPIKIAFIGAVSGGNSEIAVSTRNGALQMVDEFNAAGGLKGRNIQLDVFDNKGDKALCREIFKRIKKEKYQYVMGPLFSQMADVTLDELSDNELLFLSPTMATEALSNKDDLFIRTVSTINPQAELLAQHIGQKGKTSVSIVIDMSNEKLTVGLSKYFQKSIQNYEALLQSTHRIDSNGKVDFVELAEQLKKEQPQNILLCMSALDAAHLAQQLRKIGFNPDLYGISWTQTNDLLSQGGEAVEGMILIAALTPKDDGPAMYAFEAEYQRRYGSEASFTSVLGYRGMYVLLKGMESAESLKQQDIKRAIIEQSEYQALGATISINRFGDSQGSFSLVQVNNNIFTPVSNETSQP